MRLSWANRKSDHPVTVQIQSHVIKQINDFRHIAVGVERSAGIPRLRVVRVALRYMSRGIHVFAEDVHAGADPGQTLHESVELHPGRQVHPGADRHPNNRLHKPNLPEGRLLLQLRVDDRRRQSDVPGRHEEGTVADELQREHEQPEHRVHRSREQRVHMSDRLVRHEHLRAQSVQLVPQHQRRSALRPRVRELRPAQPAQTLVSAQAGPRGPSPAIPAQEPQLRREHRALEPRQYEESVRPAGPGLCPIQSRGTRQKQPAAQQELSGGPGPF